jgi:hypothetical protein
MISERSVNRIIEMLNEAARDGQRVVLDKAMRCCRCDQRVPEGAGVRLEDGDGWRLRMCEACWLEAERVEACD